MRRLTAQDVRASIPHECCHCFLRRAVDESLQAPAAGLVLPAPAIHAHPALHDNNQKERTGTPGSGNARGVCFLMRGYDQFMGRVCQLVLLAEDW